MKEKGRVIWRVWGGEIPVKSLVKEKDTSSVMAEWYPHGNRTSKGEKYGGIYIPSTKQRLIYKTYPAWLAEVKRNFVIVNKTISW